MHWSSGGFWTGRICREDGEEGGMEVLDGGFVYS